MASRTKAKHRSARRSRAASPRGKSDSDADHVGAIYGHIYAVVRRIPRGRVVTYGQVAELAGMPGAARVVGTAMRVSIPEMGLPWHRVVGKRSSNRAYISIHDPIGAGIQRAMLEREGVEFSAAATIALDHFGWLST